MEKIDAIQNHYDKVKATMKDIVDETRNDDIEGAFEKLNYTLAHPRDYWEYFNEAGLSPITMPNRWRIDEFESPLTYIRTRNVNNGCPD